MDEKQAMIASLINNLIRDEWEAIEGYNGVIATLADSDGDDIDGIISNLEDIRDEEYVHVGQLESCLSVLKGDPVEQIEDGSEEGFEKLELPEEEEDEEPEYEETDDLEFESLREDRANKRLTWDTKVVDYFADDYQSSKIPDITFKQIHEKGGHTYLDKLWYLDSALLDGIEDALETLQKKSPIKEDVSEEEMKRVICSMISEYDASEEEVYDELSSATPDVSRDLVHRLYQMCSGNKEEPQQETSFEDFWNEMEDMEEG